MSDSIKQIFCAPSRWRLKTFLWLFRITMIFFVIGLTAVSIDHFVVSNILEKNSFFRVIIDPEESWSIRNRYNEAFAEERSALLTAPSFSCHNCRRDARPGSLIPSSIKAIVPGDSFKALDLIPEDVNLILDGKIDIRNGTVKAIGSTKYAHLSQGITTVPFLQKADSDLNVTDIIRQLVKLETSALAVDFRSDKRQLWVLENSILFNQAGISIISIVPDSIENQNAITLLAKSDLIFIEPDVFQDSRQVINSRLQNLVKVLPSNKVVLQIPAFGRRKEKNHVEQISYHETLKLAQASSNEIMFDSDSYSHRVATSNSGNEEVAFMDAIAVFRLFRLANDMALRGVAVKAVGGEDERLWEIMKYSTKDFTIGKGEEGAELFRIIRDTSERYSSFPPGRPLKKLVLSFDDGPDEKYTKQILDILHREKVPAVFFVTGLKVEKNISLLRKIAEEGHEIGNHTYTHVNLLHVSDRRIKSEIRATTRLLECITGKSTRCYRAPGHELEYSDPEPEVLSVSFGPGEEYLRIGTPVNPQDWQKDVPADTIVRRVFSQLCKGGIILLHDGGGNRSETVKALPSIIRMAKDSGYVFTTLADYSGQSQEKLMPMLKGDSDYYLSVGNSLIADLFYWLQRIVFVLFFMGLILGVTRMLFLGVLAVKQKMRKAQIQNMDFTPLVSILIPAYNEEKRVVKTIQKLLELDYPNYEIILVDDGSSDNTYSIVRDAFPDESKVKIFAKHKAGKASALNFAIDQSGGKIILPIDADTLVDRDSLKNMIRHFSSPEVAAVAGNLKVKKRDNWLNIFQSLDYITSQNMECRAFDELNGIGLISGPFCAFRKDLVIGAGKFKSENAEDCSLAMNILRQGFRIRYANDAVAYTEVPGAINPFLTQKFQRSLGVLQSWWKHRGTLLNPKYRGMGMIAMPYIFLFAYLFPLLIPVAELLVVFSLLQGEPGQILFYYLAFLGIDLLFAAASLKMEKEPLKRLIWLLPQRLIYRWVMWLVVVKTYLNVMKEELVAWGLLRKTADVEIAEKSALR